MSEFGGGWTPEHSKRWINILAIYTVLFLVIGPKFEIYGVWSKIRDGEFVPNRIDRFVAGSHQGDTVQLCFEGTLKGKEAQMMYTASLSELEQPKQIIDGFGEVRFNDSSFEILSKDFEPDCSKIDRSNLDLASLPRTNSFVLGILNIEENQKYLETLDPGNYISYYYYERKGQRDGLKPNRFAFYSKSSNYIFYSFWIRGGLRKESDLGALDYVKAALIDYVRWPYFWLIVLTGGASH